MGQQCIYQKRAVYSKIWQHHNVLLEKPLKIASKITKIGSKMAKKTSLKNFQNQAHKKGLAAGIFRKLPQTGTPNHYPSSPTRCPRKISQLCLLNRPNRLRDERIMRVWNLGNVADFLQFIAENLQHFQNLKFRWGVPISFGTPCTQTRYATIPNSIFQTQRRSRNFHQRSFR